MSQVDTKSAAYWRQMTAPHSKPQFGRSMRQLLAALGGFAILWAAMYFSLSLPQPFGYLLTLALAVPTAGFLVLLFMIQHDCGHGSYFEKRWLRDAVGFCIGVMTLTPYEYWRKTHAYHHSHSGDLDFRDLGEIDTLTVAEYNALSAWGRFKYRAYRHPLTLLTIGPLFHFVVKHRYPWDIPRDWKKAWHGVWYTNLAVAGILLLAAYTIGLGDFLLVQAPITFFASSLGVWLFYVQHQYEEGYWRNHPEWNYFEAAIHGSSHLVLPKPLQWMTGNIGFHHVHHLSSQIPNYRLEECLAQNPELQVATKITMRDSIRLFRLALWDEESKRLIGFRELRRKATMA